MPALSSGWFGLARRLTSAAAVLFGLTAPGTLLAEGSEAADNMALLGEATLWGAPILLVVYLILRFTGGRHSGE